MYVHPGRSPLLLRSYGSACRSEQVRESRGLNDLTSSDLPTQVEFKAELVKEYMREMPGEGQIFPALKHFNSSFLDLLGSSTIQPSSSIFVLPWPQDELTYGNK